VEAKHGTNYIIPVETIQTYQPIFDEHAMPRPVVPANDPKPWVNAVRKLLTARDSYETESHASRQAANRFIGTLSAAEMEQYLCSLHRRSDTAPAHATIESLSPEKRALLLERLRKRKATS
jgi:hypothetical protein